MKIVLFTNIPAPYRVPVFDKLTKNYGNNFTVIYKKKIEKNRKWKIPKLNHNHQFINNNLKILFLLFNYSPSVIIASGFNSFSIISFIFSYLFRKKYIVFTDSWLLPTQSLTKLHKFLRKIIIQHADASICVGNKGKQFLREFGASNKSIFISPLAINNKYFSRFTKNKKEFDLLFSGQFIDRKMPFFIIDILKDLGKSISILFIGDGKLKSEIFTKLEKENINYVYSGFIQQIDLPKYYSKTKILLFPTKSDPWGIVANEACACGVPVITSQSSGVADDLVINDYNGYVLPLEKSIWVTKIRNLLNNNLLYEKLSGNCLESTKSYTYVKATEGIIQSIEYVQQ